MRKIEHVWEKMDDNTYRCKTYQGWLVRHQAVIGKSVSESMVFVRDTDYEWIVMQPIAQDHYMSGLSPE